MSTLNDWIVIFILTAGAAASFLRKKLTLTAALTGGLLGWLIYAGAGFTGLSMLALFFITGTAATAWRKKDKLSIRANAAHQPTRTAGQVFANAGVAALIGLLAVLFPAHTPLWSLMMAGSFSAATADTLSSELGMVYGRRTFNILSWRPDEKGLDGVVSLEGLLIGIAGSALIAIVYALGNGWNGRLLLIIAAGTVGNLADSLLGALFERQGWLTNNMVNLLNTLIGALTAGFLTIFG
jgi:uncharacterized protein (TIGR00297 family)